MLFRAVVAGGLLLSGAFILWLPSAYAASPAESFVQQTTTKVIDVLVDKSLSDSERHSRLEGIVAGMLDLRRMALFALGPAAQAAPASDIDAFVSAYHAYATAMYESELSDFQGQTVDVTGSTERAPGDFIVNATVCDPKTKGDATAQVSFRVLDEGAGKFALVDASVEGVWLALAQRDDFGAFLRQNGGDVSKLTAHLKEIAARAAAAAPMADVGQ